MPDYQIINEPKAKLEKAWARYAKAPIPPKGDALWPLFQVFLFAFSEGMVEGMGMTGTGHKVEFL